MLQSGVNTRDLDVRWVSSLSWYDRILTMLLEYESLPFYLRYFLNLFGLRPVFTYILGNDNGTYMISLYKLKLSKTNVKY